LRVVRAEHPEPQRIGLVALQDLADPERVAEDFDIFRRPC
jgi:hypothetical protein